MASTNLPEVWLRGPLPGCPPLLQPVAHALLQAREEINELLIRFRDDALWSRPAGVASVGFHLQHMAGVADRLFTYARGEALSEGQLSALAGEQHPPFPGCVTADLLEKFNRQIDTSLDELQQIGPDTLTSYRAVGRGQLPSTVIGLLVHCAEHTMRHTGQMLVTVRVLDSLPGSGNKRDA
jgi:uncharacterized damage-inducible protein DinB